MARLIIMLFVMTVLAFAITACGKRGKLEQPEGVSATYPRTYPSQ